MFSKDMISFLARVITSWEIIAVTIALILYFMIVSHVARLYHRPGFSFNSKPKKAKAEKAVESVMPEESDDEDLGIEEE